MRWFRSIFFTLFSSKCCNCYNSFLFITITSDVLIFSSISHMRFSRYISDWCFISHHIHKISFAYLITGKTSYHNSTALLIGLAAISCCSSVPVSIWSSAADLPFLFFSAGGHLLSHTVSSAVPSASRGLTIVFGMGTGVSPGRIATSSQLSAFDSLIPEQ